MEILRKHTWILIIALVLLSLPVVLNTSADSGNAACMVVTCVAIDSDDCQIRESIETDSAVIADPQKGQAFEVVSRLHNTLGLQMEDGRIGYISLDQVHALSPGVGNQEWIPNSSYTNWFSDEDTSQNIEGYFLKPCRKSADASAREAEIVVEENPSQETVSEIVEKIEPVELSKEEPVAKPESVVCETKEVETQKPKLVVSETKEVEPQKLEPEPMDPVQQEKDMYRLINEFRTSKGLCSLQKDSRLEDISRIKSEEMVDKDYFSHTSPTYGTPKEMLAHFNVDYDYMGEDLAYDRDAEAAFEAFRTSSQHRTILLNPDFTHIGVGVKVDDKNMIMVTVYVIDRP